MHCKGDCFIRVYRSFSMHATGKDSKPYCLIHNYTKKVHTYYTKDCADRISWARKQVI